MVVTLYLYCITIYTVCQAHWQLTSAPRQSILSFQKIFGTCSEWPSFVLLLRYESATFADRVCPLNS